jgi:ATP-dependent DNA ligase
VPCRLGTGMLSRCSPICGAASSVSPQDVASEDPAAPENALRIAARPFASPLGPPKLVAEITYLTWTADNLLRHKVYVGLREDKPAEEIRRER